jgi:RNA polymerase sigma factor (sigma-70 family)
VGERKGAPLVAGHDIRTGVGRLRTWLGQHAMTAAEIIEGPWGDHTGIRGALADWDAERAVTALYDEHYSSLVRQAWLLTLDAAAAEAVVQDSFTALHASWWRLRDSHSALLYLRQCVLNRSRSVHPRRPATRADAAGPAAGSPQAKDAEIGGPQSPAVILALRTLPARQREAVVMRYYAGLSEAEIAGIMRIGERAVRQHAERALVAMRAVLHATGATTSPGLLIAS